MSRRASNSVKLARIRLARFGTRLDRNGIPVLDDPRANRLPRQCGPGEHEFVEMKRREIGVIEDLTGWIKRVSVESRCRKCREKITETRNFAMEA